MRRARIQLADLSREVRVEFLFGPQAAAFESVGAVGAGYSLGEPERARVHFLGVIHGLERLRANAFYVPGVKKLVRGDGRGGGTRRRGYRRAIRVLHPAPADFGVGAEVIKE